MEREYLIKKWLDNELSAQELDAFEQLDDYEDLIKLSESIKHFKAPDFDSKQELDTLLQALKEKKTNSNSWFKPLLRIAAVLLLFFSVYYFTSGLNTTIHTDFAQKSSIELPDLSKVKLNAQSTLSYNKRSWKNNRQVKLEGEAYFKVAKGSKFDVITEAGTVSVLGTEFNVKQRKNYFEVICFEGLVGVTHNGQTVKLKPGFSFLLIDGKLYAKELDTRKSPNWVNNESYFMSIPYKEVLNELERQYNVKIETKNIDTSQLFTGVFKHDNLELALKSVVLPLNLNYQIKDNKTIVLSRE